jgi:hypothetical protein
VRPTSSSSATMRQHNATSAARSGSSAEPVRASVTASVMGRRASEAAWSTVIPFIRGRVVRGRGGIRA